MSEAIWFMFDCKRQKSTSLIALNMYLLGLLLPIFFCARIVFAYSEIGEPLLHNFTSEDCGSELQVWGIAEDNRGVIYVGSINGLLEFDGVRWREVEIHSNTPIRSLTADSSGRIYVGGIGEVRLYPLKICLLICGVHYNEEVVFP